MNPAGKLPPYVGRGDIPGRAVAARTKTTGASLRPGGLQPQRRPYHSRRKVISDPEPATHGHPEPADMRAADGAFDRAASNSYSAGRVETGFPTRPGFCGFAVVRA